ncbi:unnamed protein product [Lactuca virosa]|uniref:Uncharacterized protein n=1 Tax=Lactuca virosa TaxID=75947 RepID=A0AAU9MNE8_9ASTR|nr:unnamed protein product [Lactuca virosa]
MSSVYWASLNNWICVRYRSRKHTANTRVIDFEGDVEATRAQAPNGIDPQRWSDAIDHILTEQHQNRSAQNKEFWKKQVVKNRRGTYKYNSACFKNNFNRLEAFHPTHVNINGEFFDHLVEDQYNDLVVEVASQTLHIADSGGDAMQTPLIGS